MHLIAEYWWILALPFALVFAFGSWLRMPRTRLVWLLRLAAFGLLVGPAVWLITGNVHTDSVSIDMTGTQALTSAIIGVVVLVGAQRVSRRAGGGPSA